MTSTLLLLVLSCGSERWSVKTLTDPAASYIAAEPVETTVLALSEAIPPRFSPKAPRVAAEELMVLELTADIVGWKSEADGDLHVVIEDGGRSMVVEFPDPECVVGARWEAEQVAARQELLRLLGKPSKRYRKLGRPVRVRLRGVGFFDVGHGQAGGAINSIELHPVLGVKP